LHRLVVKTTTGSGKSWLVVRLAVERAKFGLRTAILCPTHELGRQLVDEIKKETPLCTQEGSPLAVIDGQGNPVCIHLGVGKGLANGGYLMRRELCGGRNPCRLRATCSAARPTRRDETLIVIAPHQYAQSAIEFVDGGLLVVDEKLEFVDVQTIGVAKLRQARHHSFKFRDGYKIRYFLDAVLEGLQHAPRDLPSLFEIGSTKLDQTQTKARGARGGLKFATAFRVNSRTCRSWMETLKEHLPQFAPSLANDAVAKLRDTDNGAEGEQVGLAAQTIRALIETLMADGHSTIEAGDVVVGNIPAHTRAAFRHDGPLIILDATHDAEELEGLLEKIGAEGFDIEDRSVSDGVPIRRILFARTHMCRSHVIDGDNNPIWSGTGLHGRGVGLLSGLRSAIDFAIDADAKQLAIISIKTVEDDIRAHWQGQGDSQALADVLNRWRNHGGRLELGHYFGLRGLDRMKTCDVLVTLMDPWINMGAFRVRCDVLGLTGCFDAQFIRACEAELDQAHGRLRTPWKEKPGILIHVGVQLALSWDRGAEVMRVPRGRTATVRNSDETSELCLWLAQSGLSLRGAADALGVSKSALARFKSGERAVPNGVLHRIRNAASSDQSGGIGVSPKPVTMYIGSENGGSHISGTPPPRTRPTHDSSKSPNSRPVRDSSKRRESSRHTLNARSSHISGTPIPESNPANDSSDCRHPLARLVRKKRR
jgi:hypothetical protein